MTLPTSEPVTRRERVQERERAILEAARAVFIERGYDGARIAEIAQRAGIAEGTVYIYFKTKNDLMRTLVADFWDDLTSGARAAVKGRRDTFEALEALAAFHLRNLVARFDFIALTQKLRNTPLEGSGFRDYMRTYVSVFDQVFQSGVDRGDFQDVASIRFPRDLFYGSLEYAARTLLLHGTEGQDEVTSDLVRVFRQSFGRPSSQSLQKTQRREAKALARLEKAVDQMEALMARAKPVSKTS